VLDGVRLGRFVAESTESIPAGGGEEDLLRHLLVVHVGLEVAPALHLGEDPDGHRVVGEGVEVHAVGHVLRVSESIGVDAGQDLFEQVDRLVQEVARRDGRRDLLSVGLVVRVLGGVDDREEKGLERVT
jgi:hypothetical protein